MVEKQKISVVVFLITALIISGILLFNKPAVTGKVIEGKETVFSENLNLQVNESGTYEWNVKNPGSVKSLKMSGSVSTNGSAKVYIEKNGTRQLLFDSTRQLLDVDIRVLPEYKKVLQGGEILIQNTLFNLRGFGSGSIDVRYSIKDSKGNLIAAEEETVFIETQAKFIRKLVIPEEIKPGTYTAFVEASTNTTIAGTGSDTFEITSKSEGKYPAELRYYLIGLAAFVAFIILLLFGVRSYNILKKKKKISELKEKAPLERIDKLEKELKALEEAYKSGLISKESFDKDNQRLQDKISSLKRR